MGARVGCSCQDCKEERLMWVVTMVREGMPAPVAELTTLFFMLRPVQGATA